MPPAVIVLERNAEGRLVDAEGNKYNEQFQRLDAADYNCPYQFYANRPTIRSPPFETNGFMMMCQRILESQQRCRDELNAKKWDSEVEEAPVQQLSEYEMLQQILESQQRFIDELNSEERPWNASQTAMGVTEETNQEEEIIEVQSEYDEEAEEEEVEFDDSGLVSFNTVPKTLIPDENLTKVEDWISFEVLTSSSATEPQPEPPEHDLDPFDDPKSPEQYKVEVAEVFDHGDTYELTVISKEAATPGSCHKRKSPDTTPQPLLKRIRAHPGAIVVIPIPAYLIDPEKTYAVYSRGPRPP